MFQKSHSFAPISRLALLGAILFSHPLAAQQLGDPGWEFDTTRFDSRIPAMREWAKAGVRGGIPLRNQNKVVRTITATSNKNDRAADIQNAINAANASGGGVVLLKNGTYWIRSQIALKST